MTGHALHLIVDRDHLVEGPDERGIQVPGMDMLRVADGKFVEHWGGVADQMDDFLSQIGAQPH